jgi:hypothetical protein
MTCIHCGKEIKQIEKEEDELVWVHTDHGLSFCSLFATPGPLKDQNTR